jgi:hypothetical protein
LPGSLLWDRGRWVAARRAAERRHPAARVSVLDAEQPPARQRVQPGQERLGQFQLVRSNSLVGAAQPVGVVTAQGFQIADRRDEPGQCLVREGAGLEPVAGRVVPGRPHPLGGPVGGQVGAQPGQAEVGPKNLYGEQSSTSQPISATSMRRCGA